MEQVIQSIASVASKEFTNTQASQKSGSVPDGHHINPWRKVPTGETAIDETLHSGEKRTMQVLRLELK